MAKQRILDANEVFAGKEPKFTGEIAENDLARTLSWYAQNKSAKDSQKYANDYFKKKLKITGALAALKGKPSQFGFVCRIVHNGAVLPKERQSWFQEQVDELKGLISEMVVEEDDDTPKMPNIQERIREKANECIAELEGQIDDMIASQFTEIPVPYVHMHTLGIKGVHTRVIMNWANERKSLLQEVLTTTDKDLRDGYSNFTKPQIKKIILYFDHVIGDCNKIKKIAAANRKPRKKKRV